MDEIRQVELALDRDAITSFHPCEYAANNYLGSGSINGYLPCHYFDSICGTGLGGYGIGFTFQVFLLIPPSPMAVMLGRLRMSVNHCIEEYIHIGEEVFAHPIRTRARKVSITFRPASRKLPRYNWGRIVGIIEDIVLRHNDVSKSHPELFYAEADLCKS